MSRRWPVVALVVMPVLLALAGWIAYYSEAQRPVELEQSGTIVSAMAYSGDGKQLATANNSPDGNSSNVRLWDVSSRDIVWEYSSENPVILSLVYSPDQSVIAVAGFFTVELLDAKTGTKRRTLKSPTKPKRDTAPTRALALTAYDAITAPIAFSPDGKTLATKYYRSYYPNLDNGFNAICLWDVKTGRRLPFPQRFSKTGVISLLFTHDGRRFIIIDAYSISVWSFPQSKLLRRWHQVGGAPTILANDGSLITFSYNKGIHCWDIDTGKLLWNFEDRFIENTVVSPDMSQMATSYGFSSMIPNDDKEDCGAQLWEIDSFRHPPQPGRKLIGYRGPDTALAFSPDGRSLATSGGGKIKIWPIK